MLSALNMLDQWHLSHPIAREFTFYSPPQDSLARLDFLFCSPLLLYSINDSSIHEMAIFDHAPISLTLNILQSHATLKL